MEITLQAAVLHLLDTHADQPVLADRPMEAQEETARYLSMLAGLNCRLARQADRVVEVVCGLPVLWKGEKA